jgi:DnaK suppressor protein
VQVSHFVISRLTDNNVSAKDRKGCDEIFQGRSMMHLKESEFIDLREHLLRERDRVSVSLKSNAVQVSAMENLGPKDEVDFANESILVTQKTRIINRENLYLKKILTSLEKLENGEYGVCEDCGAAIPYRRLKARLTSVMCIICKEESEMAENRSAIGRLSKSLGKDLQLSNVV